MRIFNEEHIFDKITNIDYSSISNKNDVLEIFNSTEEFSENKKPAPKMIIANQNTNIFV